MQNSDKTGNGAEGAAADRKGEGAQAAESDVLRYRSMVTEIADSFPAICASFDSSGRCLFVSNGARHVIPDGKVEAGSFGQILERLAGGEGTWPKALAASFESTAPISVRFSVPAERPKKILALLRIREGSGNRESHLLALDVTHEDPSPGEGATNGAWTEHQVSLVAHELRNPLSTVQAGLKILERSPSEDQARFARTSMQRQLRHISRLINDLLETSRIKSGRLVLDRSPVDVGEIVVLALEMCGERGTKPGLEVKTVLPEVRATFLADGDRLAQVVANLVDNAVKFTPAGGAITVAARYLDTEVEISVSDTGTGLSREAVETLFKPFGQLERSRSMSCNGLGLGLFIAKSLVEAHGGRIEARSEGLHKGSSFTVFIPLISG